MKRIIWYLVLLLVVVGMVYGLWSTGVWSRGYSAVYLMSGDLYFGKLVRFPTFGLKEVVSIQPTQDPNTPLAISKFSNLFWGPENFMQISRDKVIWVVRLKDEGQLAKLLKENPNLLSNSGAAPQVGSEEIVPQSPATKGENGSSPKE